MQADGGGGDAGDERQQRLRRVFDQYANVVHRYARYRVPPDAVEDIVGEVFVVAWRRIADIPADAELPWLLGVARHVVRSSARSSTDWTALHERLSQQPAEPLTDVAADVAERDRVTAALGKLPEADREAILLVYWHDLSVADAAAVVGCKPTTFTVRLHRARRRLAQLLDAAPPPDPPTVNTAASERDSRLQLGSAHGHQ